MDDVFVLLDDCHATAAAPSSRLYSGFVREHRCLDGQTLDDIGRAVLADQRAGLHAVVLADYEWGAKLQRAGCQQLRANDGSSLRVLLFERLQQLSEAAVAQWLAARDGAEQATPAGIADLRPSVSEQDYAAAIARIHALIRQGETYQVNYTFLHHGWQYGSPVGLYRRLRARQPVAFGALAALPGGHWVLSSSPELFVRKAGMQVCARPMKGTAARLPDPQQDRERAAWLAHDPKNRAENVMIVDLLRNDLGRISETGSVHVPTLFAVERYATVHQMTSTVQSRLRAGLGFPDVLRALFPCGSITGAPKLHTMELIAALEVQPRGLYCGAIGWLDAPGPQQACGDFCLSVAIRTLQLAPGTGAYRQAKLGAGGGIVLDSDAADEYAEACTKVRYLTRMDPGFTLFETMQVRRCRVRHLALHLRRLQRSAEQLGFALDLDRVRQELAQQLETLDPLGAWRLRLDLQHDGQTHWQHAALTPLGGPARLVLAQAPLPAQEALLLQHKTSLRASYDSAIQKAAALGAFDAIYHNAQGEVSEGARSTLFYRLDGRWYTPPMRSGVLAGVLRTRLLQRCPGLRERTTTLQTLQSAQALCVGSALRGLQRAHWLRDSTGAIVQV